MRISDWSSDVCSSDLAADLVGFRLLRIGIDAIRTTFRIRQLEVRAARRLLRTCVVGVNAGCFDWLVEHAELPVEQGLAVPRVGRREDGTDVRPTAVHSATGIGAGSSGVANRSRPAVGLVMIHATPTAAPATRTKQNGNDP